MRGDLQAAEERLLAASALVPDSKNVHQKLGRFYCDNCDPEKGLETLIERDMVVRVRRLERSVPGSMVS